MKKKLACMTALLLTVLCMLTVGVSAEESQLSMNMETMNIYVKQSCQLWVYGTTEDVLFISEDPKIAEVSGDGMVTAVSLGTTKITARTNTGLETACTVNVINGISPKELILDTQDITLKEGDSYTLKAQIKPVQASQAMTFSSSDEAVARVDKNGYIKALKAGVAVITVKSTSDAVLKKCIVKVNADTEAAEISVSVKGALYSITGEKKPHMFVELRNSGGFKRTETDENGVFSFETVKQGDYALLVYKGEKDVNPVSKAQLSAGIYHLNITCIMNDSELVVLYQKNNTDSEIKELVLAAKEISLNQGESYDMNYTARPSGAVLPTVMGVSEDESIASVDADGRITAVAEGKTTITFSTLDGRLSKSCEVTVSNADGSRYSGVIITVETLMILALAGAFMIRYRRFMKRREKEEFGSGGN